MVVPILLHVCENLIVTKPYDRGADIANILFLRMTAQHLVQVNSDMTWRKTSAIYIKEVFDAIWPIIDMKCGREERMFPKPMEDINSRCRPYQGLNQ